MKIRIPLSIACLVLALVPGPASLLALDVIYFDPVTKKEVKVRKVIIDKDGPEGITIKAAGKTIKVSALDVRDLDMDPPDVGSFDYQEFRKPLLKVDQAAQPARKDADRIKLWRESIPPFLELMPKLPAGSNLRRYVQFKYAQTLYRLTQLDDKNGEEAIKKNREEAVKALDAFQQEHKGGWQIAPSLMMLAQLQEDQGDLATVQKTYESLSEVPGLSDEIRTTSKINAARTLMKMDKFAEAKDKLAALKQNLPADSPLTGKVQVYLAQCQILSDNPKEAEAAEKELRGLLASSEDKVFKALAHNTLGDYYTKLKRDEDAFWEYLRVDTLYSDDRFEHARAMYHLIRLFREVKKDGDRADQLLETLTKDRRFTGLEYQKKALKK